MADSLVTVEIADVQASVTCLEKMKERIYIRKNSFVTRINVKVVVQWGLQLIMTGMLLRQIHEKPKLLVIGQVKWAEI